MKKLKQLNQNWCLTLIFSDCIRYVKPREQFSLHEPALLMMASILLVKYKYSALETFVITALYKSTFTIPCHLLLLRICFIALLCLYCLLQTVQMHYVFACSDALVCAYVHQGYEDRLSSTDSWHCQRLTIADSQLTVLRLFNDNTLFSSRLPLLIVHITFSVTIWTHASINSSDLSAALLSGVGWCDAATAATADSVVTK